MAHPALKRVIGETTLEKKCRYLFLAGLLLLVGAAFGGVAYIGEDFLHDATRRKGRDLVDMSMLKFHFEKWNTDPAEKGLVQEMLRGLENQEYDYAFLSPAGDRETQPPGDAWERQALAELESEWTRQTSDWLARAEASPDEAGEEFAPPVGLEPRYRERILEGRGEYQYYEPVYWKRSCFRCHYRLQEIGALSAAEGGALSEQDAPFRVVRVAIPYRQTREAILTARAILIAVAIVTLFLGMVLLYLIMRYVIVKPLNHLRGVSDEVFKGNLERRADLQTGDEFEELGASFNRMLRRLTDSQSALRDANAELDGKVDQLAQLNVRLYEMNRVKSDFLANMSHELRTPLNSIIGFSEVLQGLDALSDKQKRYAQNIQKSGRLLLDMINDILDLAKMEAGKMDLRPSEFRLETLVQAQCDLVRGLAEEKNLALEIAVAPDLPPLYQDQVKVQQILTNLLSNAIKFTPEGGRVSVEARRTDRGRMELIVADTGVGIPEEDREVIFEKFRQSKAVLGEDGLTREHSGTGLGLSIVKELCKLLGGEISFVSQLGIGSTFTVSLPWTLSETRGDEPGGNGRGAAGAAAERGIVIAER